MNSAVFVSDLHLHPEQAEITEHFFRFIVWASKNTKNLYILGDFFHVWPGDEALDAWSMAIADQLARLVAGGIAVYFMPGNRDFLLGEAFIRRSGMIRLKEPALITLDHEKVLLVHGDALCTQDRSHQWFRKLTRSSWFYRFFMRLPYPWRLNMVNKVRQRSQTNRSKTKQKMGVVVDSLLQLLSKHKSYKVIHGHTHDYGLVEHHHQGKLYQQYVLSDWDDHPWVLCYNESNYTYFKFV